MKRFYKGCLIVVIVSTILSVVGFLFLRSYYYKEIEIQNSDSTEVVELTILQGEGARDISKKLYDNDLIRNADIFYIYIRLNNIGPDIQAGNFEIPKNLTIIEVAQTIQKAAGNDIWITIREGLRIDEVANELEKAFLKVEDSNFDKEEFLDMVTEPDKYNLEIDFVNQYKKADESLEGFLYPAKYNVEKSITAKELVQLFVNTLEEKLGEENLDKINDSNFSVYETLTLASIIEREAKTSDERYMISDILQKRMFDGLEDGTKLLQTDATLLYEVKDWEEPITIQMKESDSPYNTYKFQGLPPTPICNPRLESILAVIQPKGNDYLYYLHDNNGEIHYAKTFEEHENNVRCFINGNTEYC